MTRALKKDTKNLHPMEALLLELLDTAKTESNDLMEILGSISPTEKKGPCLLAYARGLVTGNRTLITMLQGLVTEFRKDDFNIVETFKNFVVEFINWIDDANMVERYFCQLKDDFRTQGRELSCLGKPILNGANYAKFISGCIHLLRNPFLVDTLKSLHQKLSRMLEDFDKFLKKVDLNQIRFDKVMLLSEQSRSAGALTNKLQVVPKVSSYFALENIIDRTCNEEIYVCSAGNQFREAELLLLSLLGNAPDALAILDTSDKVGRQRFLMYPPLRKTEFLISHTKELNQFKLSHLSVEDLNCKQDNIIIAGKNGVVLSKWYTKLEQLFAPPSFNSNAAVQSVPYRKIAGLDLDIPLLEESEASGESSGEDRDGCDDDDAGDDEEEDNNNEALSIITLSVLNTQPSTKGLELKQVSRGVAKRADSDVTIEKDVKLDIIQSDERLQTSIPINKSNSLDAQIEIVPSEEMTDSIAVGGEAEFANEHTSNTNKKGGDENAPGAYLSYRNNTKAAITKCPDMNNTNTRTTKSSRRRSFFDFFRKSSEKNVGDLVNDPKLLKSGIGANDNQILTSEQNGTNTVPNALDELGSLCVPQELKDLINHESSLDYYISETLPGAVKVFELSKEDDRWLAVTMNPRVFVKLIINSNVKKCWLLIFKEVYEDSSENVLDVPLLIAELKDYSELPHLSEDSNSLKVRIEDCLKHRDIEIVLRCCTLELAGTIASRIREIRTLLESGRRKSSNTPNLDLSPDAPLDSSTTSFEEKPSSSSTVTNLDLLTAMENDTQSEMSSGPTLMACQKKQPSMSVNDATNDAILMNENNPKSLIVGNMKIRLQRQMESCFAINKPSTWKIISMYNLNVFTIWNSACKGKYFYFVLNSNNKEFDDISWFIDETLKETIFETIGRAGLLVKANEQEIYMLECKGRKELKTLCHLLEVDST